MEVFANSATLLVSSLGGLYLFAILLRFLLQVAKADFYNPVSQAVVKVTDPVVRLFRPIVPGYKGLDFSSLLIAVIIQFALIYTLIYLNEEYRMPAIGSLITWAVGGVILFIINIYYFAIIAAIVMSFIMMFSGTVNPHPILRLIWQLTDPVMTPVRKILPSMGGLDFSPIIIFIGIQILSGILRQTFGINSVVAMFVVGA
jgi:YggT family protein